jgi:hypothetical protein
MKTSRVDAFVANKKQVPELKSSLENMPAIEKPKPAVKPPAPGMPILPRNAGNDVPVPLGRPVRVVPLVTILYFI